MPIYVIHESTIIIHAPVPSEVKAIDALIHPRKVRETFISFDFDSILINYAKCVIYKNNQEEQLPIII